jgi:hypothetical protein
MMESPLDLSAARVVEPGPGLLIATTIMTPARMTGAVIFAGVCLIFIFIAWKNRTESVLEMLWPWGLLAPFWGVIAVVIAFGNQRKAFDGKARSARLTSGLGPFHTEKTVALPANGVVHITFTKEQPSRASGKATGSVIRHYAVNVNDDPELGFTVSNDRAAAGDAFHAVVLDVVLHRVA